MCCLKVSEDCRFAVHQMKRLIVDKRIKENKDSYDRTRKPLKAYNATFPFCIITHCIVGKNAAIKSGTIQGWKAERD